MSGDLQTPESPYKGVRPFEDTSVDALLFFGRESEREVIGANLMAARLTVLYGASGVGKSSVLNAGVVHNLRELARDRREFVVAAYSSWSDDDPIEGIAASVREAVEDLLGFEVDDAGGSLAERLADWSGLLAGEIYLVLDQFEEYFLYHAGEGGGSLLDELPALVTESRLRVHVLLGIREDAMARLDVFKACIPGLFANYLRLDRLDPAAARAAIEGPLVRWSEIAGESVEIEPQLVGAILAAVTAERIEGNGAAPLTASNAIEPPYLQMVLQRVWEAERETNSSVLRHATLEDLGGARTIVGEHLDRALASLDPTQRDTAAAMFGHLVTPSGTKIAHDLADLASYARAEEENVRGVAATLMEERILRPVEAPGERSRVEIFHDVLGGAIADWRRRHEAERRLEHEREQATLRHRRLLAVTVGSLLALVVMAGVTLFALDQRDEANDQARVAEAGELAARALSHLGTDPQESLRLAVEAADRDSSPGVEGVLRAALVKSRLRRVLPSGSRPVRAVAFGVGGLTTVDAAGRLRRYAPSGRAVASRDLGASVDAAAFTRDSRALVTIRGNRADLWRTANGAHLRTFAGSVPLAWGARNLLVTFVGRRLVVVNALTGRVLRRFGPMPTPAGVAVSPDGAHVAAVRGHRARVWSIRTGALVLDFVEPKSLFDVALGPRRTLATASADAAARVWDLRGNLLATLIGHGNHVTSLLFSPDGSRLVTAGKDGTARVWEVTGRELAVLARHGDAVLSTALASSGDALATIGDDGAVHLWDPRVEPELAVIGQAPVSERTPAARPPVLSPDRGTKATITGNEVQLSGESSVVLRGHRDRVTSVEFSSDGSRLLTASRDHDVRVWSSASGESLRRIRIHGEQVNDASFSPDGRWIVTASGAAALVDARTGELVFFLRGHKRSVTSAAFDASGRRIVTTGVDGTVRTHLCDVCGGHGELLALAKRRLAAIDREGG